MRSGTRVEIVECSGRLYRPRRRASEADGRRSERSRTVLGANRDRALILTRPAWNLENAWPLYPSVVPRSRSKDG